MLTLTAAAIAALILQPGRWREVGALVVIVAVSPWLALPVLAFLIVRTRISRVDPYEEVVFLQAVAAELRAGNSVRGSVVAGADRAPRLSLGHATRLCVAGVPMAEVAGELAAGLPASGRLTAAAVEIGAESGGRIAAVFSTLAAIQVDEIELRREMQASTANIRASMVVVGGLPLVGLAFSAATGRLSGMLAVGTLGVALLAVGVTLLLAGSGAIYLLARSAGSA